jgi:hypothetical protein
LKESFDAGVKQERERMLAEIRSGLKTTELDSMVAIMARARSGEQLPNIVIRVRK